MLTIAGSDPTGGAGLQADLKTFERFGVVAAAVVTAVTTQTATKVLAVSALPAAAVAAQLDAVFTTVTPKVVKCGLLATAANVSAVARALRRRAPLLVVDPVTVAGGGARLGDAKLLGAIVERLFPLATVVTVNLGEAEAIAGMPVRDEAAMRRAASRILALGPRAVVVKGGHLAGPPVDLLVVGRRARVHRIVGRRIAHGMHGTGCAFASALAAGLAHERSLEQATRAAAKHARDLIAGAVSTQDGGWLRAALR